MRCADLRDMDLKPWMLADEHACRPRVVEVDVRDQQAVQVPASDPGCPELCLEGLEAG